MLTPQETDATPIDSSAELNVMIAYEDFETGKHAKKTYDFLAANLPPDCRLSNQMWKFDVLSIPKLREMAGCDAARADIVLVSSHGGQLPAVVKEWVEMWVHEEPVGLALVALFDCDPEASEVARQYLSEVARRAGMEFFAQPDQWPGNGTPAGLLELRKPVRAQSMPLAALTSSQIFETPAPRWGLNE